MHCSIVNVCCLRDPEETLVRLLVLLLFWMILVRQRVVHFASSELIDVLAWAPSPLDLMGLVYALASLSLSIFHCFVAEIHAMPHLDLMVSLCALALPVPSEVPDYVVVCCFVRVALRVPLALVSAPLEVPCSVTVAQCSPFLFSFGIVGACSSAMSVVAFQ